MPHAENTDEHLTLLVQCINDSDFTCAAEELQYIDFSRDVITDITNPYTLLNFASYIDSVHPYLTDSINRCLEFSYYVLCILASADALSNREEDALMKRHLSKDISKRVFGEDSKEYASSLLQLGKDYYYRKDYASSEYFLLQAVEIFETYLDQNTSDYIESLVLLGNVYYNQKNLIQYRYYFEKIENPLNILASRSENDPFYMERNAYNGKYFYELGYFFLCEGEYKKAEIYLLQASQIMKNKESLQYYYLETLSSLGNLYKDLGDLEKALHYFSLVTDLSKSISGGESSRYFYSLLDLAMVQSRMGEYCSAESYMEQVLNFCQGDSIRYIDLYVGTLQDLSVLYQRKKDNEKAEKYLIQALRVIESKYGVNCFESKGILHNLGIFHKDNISLAETYLLRAIEIKKNSEGSQHPDYADSEMVLGVLYIEHAMYEKAEPYIIHSANIYLNHFLQSMEFLTESQRTKYWNKFLDRGIDTNIPILTYYLSAQKPEYSTTAYNHEVRIKGILLNSSENVKKSILQSNDTSLIKTWNELTAKKQQIIALEAKDSQSDSLTQLREEAEQLEKEITRSSATYRENMHQWSITWDSVNAALKPNQVAIEYMRAPFKEGRTKYCALLLRDTCSFPIMIPLFEEKEVVSLLNTTSTDSTRINSAFTYNENGKLLTQYIWNKVKRYIKEGDMVYFAPTGLLHQIPIENLPYDSTRTIGDVYNMVRLSSTRDLVLRKQSIIPTNAVLYGGINYNATPEDLAVDHAKYDKPSIPSYVALAVRNFRDGWADPLPGTEIEVKEIQKVLSEANIDVQCDTAEVATEEAFKALSGAHKNIIHLATHGFYWQDSTAHKEKYFAQHASFMQDNNVPVTIDPLERCGLLLAGANTALKGHSERLGDNVQDGVLTAKEISLMDLRDADLVVLSACESGLGDITGDGVFGLQRAFKMAGAQTIIMSLWKVDDNATQLLMTEFYKNWIMSKGKMSKRDAFRKAQSIVRSQYNDPKDWAGFILLD